MGLPQWGWRGWPKGWMMLTVTHAGFDEDWQRWGLWAKSGDGQEWFIPTDAELCGRLLNEDVVKDMADEQRGAE